MELRHILIEKLHDTKINMRHDRKPPDVSDLLPGIRQRGILQTLLVRPYPERGDGEFEIVSGRRRYWSGRAIAAELGEIAPLPCGVMEAGDDAAAIEASLMENLARRDADPMTEYETFARLIKEGRRIEDIAATFGLTVLTVKQRLALANLLPKIRDAYRAGEIGDESIRHLTLASKGQQKDWLKLFESKNGHAPLGWQLKQWLFGGQQISTKAALFPLEDYKGHVVTDLFGDDTYFADADLFWQLQNAAIEAKCDALREAGWTDVIVLEPGAHFATWEHDKTPKKKGGKVFFTVSHTGEVELFEGWLNRKEARKAARSEAKANAANGESATPDARPQMTQAMENYIELHRHAVARLALLGNPGVAFRLLIAHAIASSGNWSVKPDPQRARSKEIENNIVRGEAQAAFALERQAVLALLDWPKAEFAANPGGETDTVCAFTRLLALSDADVMRVAACVMAETLTVGNAAVESVGLHLKADAGAVWHPDDTFFDLLRDRAAVNAMVAEIAGKSVAKANLSEKVKTQKQIIRDCLTGSNGRAKTENWLPRWLLFPFKSYGKGASRIAIAAKAAA